jgi:hypothetical protein
MNTEFKCVSSSEYVTSNLKTNAEQLTAKNSEGNGRSVFEYHSGIFLQLKIAEKLKLW